MAEFDLSGWARRDERRREEIRRVLDRVRSSLEALRAVLRAHGVAEAYLFGSVAADRPRPGSDLDVAISGGRPESFYRLAAELERAAGMPLDLIDLGLAPAALADAIRRDGRRILP